MVLVNIFHAIYVIDFFYHEDWYLRTIDMAHDHFGFYFGWGDTVWLPFMYNVQAYYLYKHPVTLEGFWLVLTLLVAFTGYAIFRTVNNQKDIVRKTQGNCTIWGQPAKFI